MRKFTRHRTLEELRATCAQKKWKLETKAFRAGSDFVSFLFRIKTLSTPVTGIALVSMFNGRFFGTLDSGEDFSSDNTEHENKRWFQILLDTVYTSKD